MNLEIVVSVKARIDLRAIADYIARDSRSAATRMIKRLEREINQLGTQPGIGEQCDYLSPDLRRMSCGVYLLYYKLREDHLEIVRVLHGARDVENLF